MHTAPGFSMVIRQLVLTNMVFHLTHMPSQWGLAHNELLVVFPPYDIVKPVGETTLS